MPLSGRLTCNAGSKKRAGEQWERGKMLSSKGWLSGVILAAMTKYWWCPDPSIVPSIGIYIVYLLMYPDTYLHP